MLSVSGGLGRVLQSAAIRGLGVELRGGDGYLQFLSLWRLRKWVVSWEQGPQDGAKTTVSVA